MSSIVIFIDESPFWPSSTVKTDFSDKDREMQVYGYSHKYLNCIFILKNISCKFCHRACDLPRCRLLAWSALPSMYSLILSKQASYPIGKRLVTLRTKKKSLGDSHTWIGILVLKIYDFSALEHPSMQNTQNEAHFLKPLFWVSL